MILLAFDDGVVSIVTVGRVWAISPSSDVTSDQSSDVTSLEGFADVTRNTTDYRSGFDSIISGGHFMGAPENLGFYANLHTKLLRLNASEANIFGPVMVFLL